MDKTENVVAEETAVWTLDKAHTHIQFTARHMLVANVRGTFDDFSGTLSMKDHDISTAKTEIIINVNSINTGTPDRDKHLKSADFFDVTHHEKATFKSADIEKIDDETYIIHGDLTIRGITKPITLKAISGAPIKDADGNDRMGLEVSGKINRFDFDLKWNALLEAGAAVVGPDIKILADVEFIKK